MIKVLIVDDQELFRESLKVVLGVSTHLRVTDAVPGVMQAIKSAEQERPDVVLMDIRMPGTFISDICLYQVYFPGGSDSKGSACNA